MKKSAMSKRKLRASAYQSIMVTGVVVNQLLIMIRKLQKGRTLSSEDQKEIEAAIYWRTQSNKLIKKFNRAAGGDWLDAHAGKW